MCPAMCSGQKVLLSNTASNTELNSFLKLHLWSVFLTTSALLGQVSRKRVLLASL